MITVSVRNLVEAIREADAFKVPEMNEGTEYLYRSVYNKLERDIEVKLSDIDFDAFEAEDVDSLNDLHSDIFERNHYSADKLSSALKSLAPASKAVAYV